MVTYHRVITAEIAETAEFQYRVSPLRFCVLYCGIRGHGDPT